MTNTVTCFFIIVRDLKSNWAGTGDLNPNMAFRDSYNIAWLSHGECQVVRTGLGDESKLYFSTGSLDVLNPYTTS